jgi:hypothetical protein
LEKEIQSIVELDVSTWLSGIYWLKAGDVTKKLVID